MPKYSRIPPFLVLVPAFVAERRAQIEAKMNEVRAEAGRRSSIKSIHDIDNRWRQVTKSSVPYGGGCYAVYRGAKLIYIGSTYNLRLRLSAYWWDAARWQTNEAQPLSVKVKPSRRRGDWLMIEYRLIVRLCPELNRTHVNDSRRGVQNGVGGCGPNST